jgi:hypothetical protein
MGRFDQAVKIADTLIGVAFAVVWSVISTVAAFILLLLVWWLFFSTPAAAHDHWISRGNYSDPVERWHCCGEDDCDPVSPDDIQPTTGGYLIKSTKETIPFKRTIPAEPDDDGVTRYYTCRWKKLSDPNTLRCFFAPFGGS